MRKKLFTVNLLNLYGNEKAKKREKDIKESKIETRKREITNNCSWLDLKKKINKTFWLLDFWYRIDKIYKFVLTTIIYKPQVNSYNDTR